VDLLEADDEHWTVVLGQDRRLDLDHVIGPDREEEAVEGGVMKLAERYAVADDRVALRMAVGRDVGGVQELLVTQAAERASCLVSAQNSLAEELLVKPLADRSRHVLAPGLRAVVGNSIGRQLIGGRNVVYLNGKPLVSAIVADHECRICGHIRPGLD